MVSATCLVKRKVRIHQAGAAHEKVLTTGDTEERRVTPRRAAPGNHASVHLIARCSLSCGTAIPRTTRSMILTTTRSRAGGQECPPYNLLLRDQARLRLSRLCRRLRRCFGLRSLHGTAAVGVGTSLQIEVTVVVTRVVVRVIVRAWPVQVAGWRVVVVGRIVVRRIVV